MSVVPAPSAVRPGLVPTHRIRASAPAAVTDFIAATSDSPRAVECRHQTPSRPGSSPRFRPDLLEVHADHSHGGHVAVPVQGERDVLALEVPRAFVLAGRERVEVKVAQRTPEPVPPEPYRPVRDGKSDVAVGRLRIR